MQKTETFPNPNSKSSLQEVLTRAATTPEPITTRHLRRTSDKAAASANTAPLNSVSAHVVGHDYGVSGSGVVFEQISRKPYDLSYAYLLIPRFNSHYLIGDIAENLREWIRQICVSFAWRLEDISVRPEYLQWVLYVPAATPPSRCIRTIREQTSRLIFDDFPDIRQENISDDFWAPGYLVLVGPTPHPPEMINEFIRLTRQQQGIPPRLRR